MEPSKDKCIDQRHRNTCDMSMAHGAAVAGLCSVFMLSTDFSAGSAFRKTPVMLMVIETGMKGGLCTHTHRLPCVGFSGVMMCELACSKHRAKGTMPRTSELG